MERELIFGMDILSHLFPSDEMLRYSIPPSALATPPQVHGLAQRALRLAAPVINVLTEKATSFFPDSHLQHLPQRQRRRLEELQVAVVDVDFSAQASTAPTVTDDSE